MKGRYPGSNCPFFYLSNLKLYFGVNGCTEKKYIIFVTLFRLKYY